MKKILFLFGISMLALGAFSCSKKVAFQLVIHAGGGAINPDSASSGTLVLSDVSKHVFYLSDRPEREAGKGSMQLFIENWSKGPNSFKKDHPNAVIVGNLSTKDHPFTQIPVLIYAPEYNSETDQLNLKIKTFNDTYQLKQESLGETMLFIDDGLTNNCSHPANNPCCCSGASVL